MPLRFHLYPLLLLLANPAVAQVADSTSASSYPAQGTRYREKAIALVLGIHQQPYRKGDNEGAIRKYAEIGIHRAILLKDQWHGTDVLTHGLSVEYAPGAVPVFGFKYGALAYFYAASFGIHTVYYTDFHRGNLKLRAEFGIPLYPARLTMGINIPTLRNAAYPELRRADFQFSANVVLPMKMISSEPAPYRK